MILNLWFAHYLFQQTYFHRKIKVNNRIWSVKIMAIVDLANVLHMSEVSIRKKLEKKIIILIIWFWILECNMQQDDNDDWKTY